MQTELLVREFAELLQQDPVEREISRYLMEQQNENARLAERVAVAAARLSELALENQELRALLNQRSEEKAQDLRADPLTWTSTEVLNYYLAEAERIFDQTIRIQGRERPYIYRSIDDFRRQNKWNWAEYKDYIDDMMLVFAKPRFLPQLGHLYSSSMLKQVQTRRSSRSSGSVRKHAVEPSAWGELKRMRRSTL